MFHRHLSWMILILVSLALVVGCAPKASEKVVEAEKDLEEAWKAERDAAVSEMKKGIDGASREIELMRARAVELERAAQADAAAAWNSAADRLAEARDAAAREVQVLEKAGAEAWESTKQAAAATTRTLERASARAAAFAADAKEEFVAEARAAVEEVDRELAWAKEKLAAADGAVRKEWQVLVDELERERNRTVAELHKIEEAAADAWAEMRHGFVAAYHDLRDASKRAMKSLGSV